MSYEIKDNIALPKPLYFIGQELYCVDVDDNGKCSMDTYVVRTIRDGYAYAILKTSLANVP